MNTERHRQQAARGIAANELHVVVQSSCSNRLSLNAASHASSTSGSVSASVNHAGSAPIARQISKFTASALYARSAGSILGKKWMPATSVSVLIAGSAFQNIQGARNRRQYRFQHQDESYYTVKITGNQGKLATCHTLCLSRKRPETAGIDRPLSFRPMNHIWDRESPELLYPVRR